jgi:hypothetical protein
VSTGSSITKGKCQNFRIPSTKTTDHYKPKRSEKPIKPQKIGRVETMIFFYEFLIDWFN